jgi:hypothetical protein
LLSAQEHFSGINISRRTGILNAGVNPAELVNMGSKFEVNVFGTSVNVANNVIGFKDITGGEDLENLLFKSDKAVNMKVDAEIYGPSFAMKINKWAFGITTKANAKLSLVDVDSKLADAIVNGNTNGLINLGSTTIGDNYNQRLNSTTWGEVGISAARNVYENENHRFNAGITFKLLFPGSYSNLGVDQFAGTIDYNLGNPLLRNTNANVNIAYSGKLAESFTKFDDYSQSIFGKLNGFAVDFGFNYQWKDKENSGYKINSGLAIRNIGGMTFKDGNNSSTNYNLKIQGTDYLELSKFSGSNNLADVEKVLLDSGFLNVTPQKTDFRVKLPTVLTLYTDVKVVPMFYVSLYTQQKLGNNDKNDQVTTQNVFSLTPRFSMKNFEAYSSWSSNEISGVTGGLGFRVYGFYLGSSSIITALTSNSKQADFYLGYRVGFL